MADTVVIINEDGDNTYFVVPTKEIPPRLKKLNGSHTYACYADYDERILIHQFFGMGLDCSLVEDNSKVLKAKSQTPKFEKYRQTQPFLLDPNGKFLTLTLESST